MSSYAVTGASRGIGLAFIKELSRNPDNTLFAIIRNPATAPALYDLASSNSKIHILVAGVSDGASIEAAAKKVGEVTGGTLDVLINNAGGVGGAVTRGFGSYIGKHEELKRDILETKLDINLFSTLFTTNAFLPFILAGTQKKIISITSGLASEAVILKSKLAGALGYTVSKAGMNVAVAKYAVEYGAKEGNMGSGDGVKFLSISPGWVATEAAPPIDGPFYPVMLEGFRRIEPGLEGMISTEESVRDMLGVIEGLTAQESGRFVSHHGDENWF